MPELPEVESIRLTLLKHVLGQKIIKVNIIWPQAVSTWEERDFKELVEDKKIDSIDRRGKYLLIDLNNGLTMIVHFRMTGRLIYYPEKQVPNKHTHVVFTLENGELHYSDIRKFGRIQLIPTKDVMKFSPLIKLGPEPLDEAFAFDKFGQRLAQKKSSIKAALLDQKIIAGLGNIYVDEALFRAGILPERNTRSLKVSEIILLFNAVQEILKAGIEAGGTSFRDYRDANGNRGQFQDKLMVYGRGGMPCKVCGTILQKKKIVGRTTVFCPYCQK